MRIIQSALHAAGGAPFGLVRGEAGSKAVHEEPDHALHLADRVRAAERRAEEAERERDEAVARTRGAEMERDMARQQRDAAERERWERNEAAWEAADRRLEEATPEPDRPPDAIPLPKPKPKPDAVVRGKDLSADRAWPTLWRRKR